MGFDTSFHPVDMDVLSRLHPWILGEDAPIDDLVHRAVRIAKVRFRANAWGLGAMNQSEKLIAHLHVWGRPFFITSEGTEAIAAAIDTYLDAQPEEVDSIARLMLEGLEPGLADRCQPSEGGKLPSDENLAIGIRRRVDVMRDCAAAIRAGQAQIPFGDGTLDAGPVLQRELMDAVLEFSAHLRPGWMSRGHTWPTMLLQESEARSLFIANAALVMPVYKAFPNLQWAAADAIYENYMVGGCLSPKDIPAVREALGELSDPELALDRRKLDEALADAHFRHQPFAEATEIYSGIGGTMN